MLVWFMYVWAESETKHLFLNLKQFSWMKCDMISLKLPYNLMWIIRLFDVINKTKTEMFLQRQNSKQFNYSKRFNIYNASSYTIIYQTA